MFTGVDFSEPRLKVWVCGSRGIRDYGLVADLVETGLAGEKSDIILRTGGASGVDEQAELWAKKNGVRIAPPLIPDWSVGKHAGILRNEQGIDWADVVIAIWDGESPGTKHCIEYATKTGKKLYTFVSHAH